MRTKILMLFFIGFTVTILSAFKPGGNEIGNKELLEIIAGRSKLALFNFTVKMAAVDTRPYNPNEKITYPPTTLFKSRSTDTSTHGGKIFKLAIKGDSNYAYDLTQPDGQTIVMSTWAYKEARTTLGDGKSLRLADSLFLNPTTPSNLYLMYKSNSKEYGTDSGWVYAVISADGSKVLQKGLIASCMKCHRQSKTDRMLGAK